MSDDPICPCEGFEHPKRIWNPPGRARVDYRVGDYTAFRRALLLSLPGETELTAWRPGATGDLAVQLVEWWAYLADILTFYNERHITQAFLRTADLPESVKRLVAILGYRPSPGVGASGVVAALLTGRQPVTLPRGFQIQSKPGPGQEPQFFELDAETVVTAPDVVEADPAPSGALLQADASGASTVLLDGSVTKAVKEGDLVLLLPKNWGGSGHALATVRSVVVEKDPRGKPKTRVAFTAAPSGLGGAQVANYRLLKSSQSSLLWPYSTASNSTVITNSGADLDSVVRTVKTGDPVLFEVPGTPSTRRLVRVTSYAEVVWYANTTNSTNPAVAPASPAIPIPITHTRVAYASGDAGTLSASRPNVVVRHTWQDVGDLVAAPAQALGAGASATLRAAFASTNFPAGDSRPVLVEDADGRGATASAEAGTTAGSVGLTGLSSPTEPLRAPLRVLLNLLHVSRGKTVESEVLGSGDARAAGQEFVLKKSPLTYLLSTDSGSGENYTSTLRVWVDGVEWKEVPSFYGRGPRDRVFVTREDVGDKTHVMFGDGVNGARLPSGVNNVVASYRHGSGAAAPAAGKLTVIVRPQPNLKSIVNPVPVGGGADPDPPEQIRRYAPRSILTFGRAVSGDDYETMAAQTPGVSRARAYWSFDHAEQRAAVVVYVGDDASAVAAARLTLARAGDPNRPVVVRQATAVPVRLILTLRVAGDYEPTKVVANVTAALLGPEAGLFGSSAVRIGQAVYRSRIYAACLGVEGATAVRGLIFMANRGSGLAAEPGFRYSPGEGGFFLLDAANLFISPEAPDHA